jgi:hypothetical protein
MGVGTVWDDALADIKQKVACASWIGHHEPYGKAEMPVFFKRLQQWGTFTDK